MTTPTRVIITCEHGGNLVPADFRELFVGQQGVLDTHRGYDIGALIMGKELAHKFSAPLVASTTSRLLIDLNRTLGHRQSLSEFTRTAPPDVVTRIIDQVHRPHWDKVQGLVSDFVRREEQVVHIASHSFTPELDGVVRTTDVGLLYDPQRTGEVALVEQWRASLADTAPELRVRRNYPYVGTGDGLTTYLRTRFDQTRYVGIELEVNQAITSHPESWAEVRKALIGALATCLEPNPS
ncbi:N-formylglutamate amidohydrolase [Actinomycetes bacterium M1A6_2h]